MLLQVVYTDTAADEPSDRVMEFHGSNTDINAGFGGKYVSLVPKYTDGAAFAVTMFSVVLQGSSSPLNDYDDLAKGASGEYRYLVPVYDQNQKEKITALELFRSSKIMSDTEREEVRKCGYTGVSADINKNRRGDYLYLMWKTEITS
ncbi:hypothetical protein WOLCODRAFT_108250 [Wolfiporia cocos MD-104 SS10]|uniref:Uncharacterized protein n=1 Tax=Wolfiporia cocos (strain MD-104) TaxID=742152 RepID=A0A2H3JBK8_WOLCO|nr:hypothetical protein WOLCODRAFT_108250 [Wolfiporia cocos MD-104 SS10]